MLCLIVTKVKDFCGYLITCSSTFVIIRDYFMISYEVLPASNVHSIQKLSFFESHNYV